MNWSRTCAVLLLAGIVFLAGCEGGRKGSNRGSTSKGRRPSSTSSTGTASSDYTRNNQKKEHEAPKPSAPKVDTPAQPATNPHSSGTSHVTNTNGGEPGHVGFKPAYTGAQGSNPGGAPYPGGFAQPQNTGGYSQTHAGGYGQPSPGGYGQTNAGGYGQPNPGGYGQTHAGGYGQPSPGGYGQTHAGGYGQPSPGGYGQTHAGGYGQPNPGGYGQPSPGGYGQPNPGGYGQPYSGGYGQSHSPGMGGYGQPHQGGFGQSQGFGGGYGHSGGNGQMGGGFGQMSNPYMGGGGYGQNRGVGKAGILGIAAASMAVGSLGVLGVQALAGSGSRNHDSQFGRHGEVPLVTASPGVTGAAGAAGATGATGATGAAGAAGPTGAAVDAGGTGTAGATDVSGVHVIPDQSGVAEKTAITSPVPVEPTNVAVDQDIHIPIGSFIAQPVVKVEGMDVFFDCITTQPTTNEIEWKKNEEILKDDPEHGIILNNMTLQLKNVSKKDSGNYSCAKEDWESSPYDLDVLYLPACSPDQPRVIRAAKNETVNITCEVDSNPPEVMFQWMFNNSATTLDIHPSHFFQLGTVSLIVYTPLADLDYGTFQCLAYNRVGRQREPCVVDLVPEDASETDDTIQPFEEIDKSTMTQVEEVTNDSSTINEMVTTPSSDMETYESEKSTVYLEGPDDLPRSKRLETGGLSITNLGISTNLTMPKSGVNNQTSHSEFEGSSQLSSPRKHNQNQKSLDIFDISSTQLTETITETISELSIINQDSSSQLELPKIVAGSKLSSPNTDGSGRLSRPKTNASVRTVSSSLRDTNHGTPQGGLLEAPTLAPTLNDPNVMMTFIREGKSSTFETLEQMSTPQTMAVSQNVLVSES